MDSAKNGRLPRRTLWRATAAAAAVLSVVVVGLVGAPPTRGRAAAATTVQGESPVRTNIPVAEDGRASGGAYLKLDTTRRPPSGGWYATYRVNAPADGAYRMEVAATSPVEQWGQQAWGSYFDLSVNGAPFAQAAWSQPRWTGSPHAWGDLYRLRLDDVELKRGANTVTFRVDGAVAAAPAVRYRLLLDAFTLARTDLALREVGSATPGNIGVYRDGERADLLLRLNARTPTAWPVRYEIHDYFGRRVGAGTATIPAGAASATVPLPGLPAGNFRVSASRPGSSGGAVVGHLARLPGRRPVTGEANRFGVNVWAAGVVPPSRLDPVLAAMREMGAGHARDGDDWPTAEPSRGRYVSTPYDALVRAYHAHGLTSMDTITEPPGWAVPPTSAPLPADLRDAYAFARQRAGKTGAARSDAIHLSNEPESDDTASTGDQQAAYVKAAALGAADRRGPRQATVLPTYYVPGYFQDLVLQNQVAGYADYWAWQAYPNGYPDPVNPRLPAEDLRKHRELKRLHGARTPLWAAEAGAYIRSSPDGLSRESQVTQARYLVRSTVEGFAGGVARSYWFSGTPIGYLSAGGGEEAVYFGLLSPTFQPWPAYSAHAAMASILGEADHVGPARGLPDGVTGQVFAAHGKTVTVVWADKPTRVDVPTPGRRVEILDIMGARQGVATPARNGTVRVAASPDPVYLASDAAAPKTAPAAAPVRRAKPSRAEHIVLAQRFAPRNAAPNKNGDGTEGPPHGYRLDPATSMNLDVYNFSDTAQTVTVTARAYGGWSVRPSTGSAATVRVPAHGRVSVPHTVTAPAAVRRGVDYPLVFDATTDGRPVTPSVGRVQRPAAKPGTPVPLAPSITDLSPRGGTTVAGPRVSLSARVTDALSGVDARRLTLQVDGRDVPARFDPSTGRLTASARLAPGRHEVWVRAYNRAHAPSQASAAFTVAGLRRTGS
ncbi:hypothetical protein [Actinomadura litoris]|uniref:Uncharacterized protein n=1 Tax=Actinomadura litoris TaxID=2678616 RepID=A0A7K1KU66_9ACTN|nr:hypothetical protein [Actinomadura litoris]MUN35728.1 hypothetical protein [Actinomadura litoris]